MYLHVLVRRQLTHYLLTLLYKRHSNVQVVDHLI